MKNHVVLLISLFLFTNISWSQTKAEKKEAKRQQEAKAYIEMKALVDSEQFSFEAEWLTTQGGRRINLIGNPNFLNLNHQTAEADLPYFGVAHIANYGEPGGIIFEGPISDYKVTYNDKKQLVNIKFSAKNKNENFNITFKVFANKSADLFVYSSNRNSINYEGAIKATPQKED